MLQTISAQARILATPIVLGCTLALFGCGDGSSSSTAATSATPAATSTAAATAAATATPTSTATALPPNVTATDVPVAPAPVSDPTPAPTPAPVVTTPSTLAFAATTAAVPQSAGSVVVSVKRSGATTTAVSVKYATTDGTAVAGTAYQATSGTLNWAANETSAKSFSVPLISKSFTGKRTFNVALTNPSTGAAVGSPASTSVTVAGSATTSTPGFSIKVVDAHFEDGGGNTVQLRGVNVSGLEFVAIGNWDPSNPWGAQTGDATPNWSTIKSWGANAVRLPLNEASWLGLSCIDVGGMDGKAGALIKADPGNNYQATVEKSVADAHAAGLYVILDLHWAAPNSNGTPVCPTIQNGMADADHSIDFWKSVAMQFKDDPAVVFELFNEPFLMPSAFVGNTPWTALQTGGSMYTVKYSGGSGREDLNWQTVGMQALLDAVRSTGSTNVVLTSTLDWSSQIDGWLKYKPTDSAGQLGAVWHAYPAGNGTQVGCMADGIVGGQPGCSALEMQAAKDIVAAGYPLVITEFGDAIGGSTSPWSAILLPFADTNGISYLAWTWDKWGNANANVLIKNAAGDPTQGYGTYIKQHFLCRAAGTASCQ